MERIPFNKPCFVGSELRYIEEAVRGGHISGNGPFSKRCEELLARELEARRVLLTTSCTHALEMAALLLDIQPDDEVIVPSFTFVSTVNAFALFGARPVFCDVREDTLNLDESVVPLLVTERTKAIVPVHYAGVSCAMGPIVRAAESVGAAIVEDNAHGLFARQDGRPLGSTGALSTLSFHETKNFICGEGGALVINDAALVEAAEIAREKGTNRAAFFRGQVDKYTWVAKGSSWLPSDLLAAFLLAQLECKERILAQRARIWRAYHARLGDWARENGVRLPVLPEGSEPSWHMYHLRLPCLAERTRLIEHLDAHGVMGVFHYVPLHLSPMGRKLGGKPGDCPNAERASETLVRLPFYDELTEQEQERVCEAVLSFRVREDAEA